MSREGCFPVESPEGDRYCRISGSMGHNDEPWTEGWCPEAAALADAAAAPYVAALAAAEADWRKVTSVMGYGDGITEPQATPDEFIEAMEGIAGEAAEWRDANLWRVDCAVAGHPYDQDCHEHDPALRLMSSEAEVARLTTALGEAQARMRAPLADPATPTGGTDR